ncbi:putative nodulin-like [Lyophyllum shimeji]|uniref:Nodulin-like n=1 Tax=Lyophyllum shimeji TaxID=47721 RepID=A0A9P3PVL3_LYOSH|nr:putative nodulin-like [Lyophyllum shimeji]
MFGSRPKPDSENARPTRKTFNTTTTTRLASCASMSLKATQYPGPISSPRLTTLLASCLVTLSAGSHYVYSAYAPQLGSRLEITHTQLNFVGFAAHLGVYGSAPLWGRIVDARGPKILLASAFALLLIGYSGIRWILDAGIPASSTTISASTFSLLVLCSFMTGVGGNAGLIGSVNSTAKTFPDSARATTTGLVISGFGLSAFLFSTVSRVAFPGDTSSFILLLTLGTSIPMILGYFLVRPIPLPPIVSAKIVAQGAQNVHEASDQLETESSPLLASSQDVLQASVQLSGRAAISKGLAPNVFGHELFASTDFWLLFTMLALLVGTGFVYTNNVGTMSQALYARSAVEYDPVEAARWQATQVSTFSLLNFAGRILIGLVADYGKNSFGFPRSYALVLVSSLYFISQLMAANIDGIANLRMASAMVGLSHGSVSSLFPNVCLEWFGMAHFSENFGYIAVSPIISGNLFALVFGRNLDAHNPPEDAGSPLRTSISSSSELGLKAQARPPALYMGVPRQSYCQAESSMILLVSPLDQANALEWKASVDDTEFQLPELLNNDIDPDNRVSPTIQKALRRRAATEWCPRVLRKF